MGKMTDFESSSYAAWPYVSWGKKHTLSNDNWHQLGTYVGLCGMVIIYRTSDPYLMLKSTKAGQMHSRIWHHSFGDKTVAQLAREFLEDIEKGEVVDD